MWPFSRPYPTLTVEQLARLDTTYDYIIVGGGSAGCVLAARLSEDPSVSVLLIERGKVDDTWASRVPLLSANFFRDGAPATIFPGVPQEYANKRILSAVIGEGLGGCSRINSTVYTRGIGDYNLWRDMGHPSWSYDELEPYFVKSECSLSQPPSSYRGKIGPWTNRTFPTSPFLCMKHIVRAANKAGIPSVTDINSPTSPATCCASLDTTIDASNRRVSTMDAFLPKSTVLKRPNLTICSETLVTSLKFESMDKNIRVVGVSCEAAGLTRRLPFSVEANREVILCAGAVASPQLLMLSGVGPRSHLSEVGIEVVKDLPGVGNYLKDHPSIPLMYEIPLNDSIHYLQNKPLLALREFFRYLVSGNGLFGRAFLNSTIFVQSSRLGDDLTMKPGDAASCDVRNPENIPDIEIMPVPHRCSDGESTDIDKLGLFSLLVCLVKPQSHGTVRLASTDPHDRAQVDFGLLENREDAAVFKQGIRLALKLARDMETQGYPMKPVLLPESEGEDDLDKFLRENVRTSFHYAATCRMAPEDDVQPGVVDDELRVHGIAGLRICDTSVFPEIVSTHTMAPAVVFAEKCADLIKTTWAKRD